MLVTGCVSRPAEPSARAQVRDATGQLLGTLDLLQAGATTHLRGALQGLTPGVHALHVHQVGRCEPPFTSAGGHFNPDNVPHGRETAGGGHAGDLPNVQVDAAGTVRIDAVVRAPLRGERGMLDADGAAVVLHAQADDERTDPAGNAGDRIACGVIAP
jgi:Cu-Zn family superoxide dismutase